MSLPVVLIHGYSSEGKTLDGTSYDATSIAKIYGSLVARLRGQGVNVVPVNVSRYVSLDDGVSVDDLSLAFERALRREHRALLEGEFDVIVHSTGALVARNWIRRHTKPGACPVRHLVHLAGANLGSGWAQVGSTQALKFMRMAQGVQRGLAVLGALELASSWTLDLHAHFLTAGHDMLADYGVMEFCLVGSQAPPEYVVVPIRYGKEDGSDGVVRVSTSNLNFNYLRVGPTQTASDVDWDEAAKYAKAATRAGLTATATPRAFDGDYYGVRFESRPGSAPVGPEAADETPRPTVPFAIPYGTNHSDRTNKGAIVSGTVSQEDVDPLLALALRATRDDYAGLVAEFQATTDRTYARVRSDDHPSGLLARLGAAVQNALDNPRGQYDPHSHLVFRVCDQLGQPVNDFSVYFNSFGGDGRPAELINGLFEDQHKNDRTPNTISFYLRNRCWDEGARNWEPRLPAVGGVDLEIDALDPATQRVLFLPLRLRISAEQLASWIEPHRTTIVDVRLMRLPHKVTFILRPTSDGGGPAPNPDAGPGTSEEAA